MKKNLEDYIKVIEEEVTLTNEEIVGLVKKKKKDFKAPINDETAIFMVADDLKVILTEAITKKPEEEKFEIAVQEPQETSSTTEITRYPSEKEIMFLIKRRQFIKENLIDKKTDIMIIQGNEFPKKSAWRKYINAFGISIDVLNLRIYEDGDDVIAEYRVKATAPNGQYIIADGTKSKSEYWSDKYNNYGSYNLHNLKATARTRAVNIAVSDLVGYGKESYEELSPKSIQELEKGYETLPEKDFNM